jgi:hypothetical protein
MLPLRVAAQDPAATNQNVSLTGKVESKVLYGKPNFGQTPDRDEKYTAYFLRFSPAVTFVDTVDTGDLKRGDAVLDDVQLTTASDHLSLSKFIGKTVHIEAVVEPGVTGYVVTPYILKVTKANVVSDDGKLP